MTSVTPVWAIRIEHLERKMHEHDDDIAELLKRTALLQDANLKPLLSNSAVLVELRRIADTLEDLRSDVTFSPPEPAQPCDCDELWRLARAFAYEWHSNSTSNSDAVALVAYVREHS